MLLKEKLKNRSVSIKMYSKRKITYYAECPISESYDVMHDV